MTDEKKRNSAEAGREGRGEPAPPDDLDTDGLPETGRQNPSDRVFLGRLGDRVRQIRTSRGMSRKALAKDSGLSERYLAQLEAGRGNISIVLLRQAARALGAPLEALVFDGPEPPLEFVHSVELLRRLPTLEIERAHRLLVEEFGGSDQDLRRRRIALIGLRGAGKSSVGALLATKLNVPFVELDREIERESGMPLSTLFDLYGQPAFRRLERKCLDQLVDEHRALVIATGGSLVSEPATFERLLSSCYTVWIKATPSQHMERVVAQGDMRPMANNREAMADLQRILKAREPLYRQADAQIDTTGATLEDSVAAVLELLQEDAAHPS
jgi:XRE family aerobic/anaerobic benzoate catabolism transcriptional regulator